MDTICMIIQPREIEKKPQAINSMEFFQAWAFWFLKYQFNLFFV